MRRSGHLTTYRRGVLVVPSVPPSRAQPILAACLAAGPGAVASRWAAGALHGFTGIAPGTIEIMVPDRIRLDGVTVHLATAPLDRRALTRCDGVPATSVGRTLIDLAGTGRIWLVERALDDAIVRGLCRLDLLGEAVERAGSRRGVAEMRRLLANRQDDRLDSHQEARWLRVIRRAVGPGVEVALHHKVETTVGMREIDLAFPAQMVGFEVNGWEAHGRRSAFDHDAEKGLLLLADGWHIATLTSNMNDRVVAESVVAILHRYGRSSGQLDAL